MHDSYCHFRAENLNYFSSIYGYLSHNFHIFTFNPLDIPRRHFIRSISFNPFERGMLIRYSLPFDPRFTY